MKKRMLALLLALATLMVMIAPSAMAATAAIRSVEYEGRGRVEVEFKRNVQYKNLKLVVKDAKKKTVKATVAGFDEDDLVFVVDDVKPNAKYTFTISGVRAGRSGGYGKVTGSFKTPDESKPVIENVDYDAEDEQLEIEFMGRVEYKNARVAVKSAKGKKLVAEIDYKKSDEMEVYVEGIVLGEKYTVTVSGVRRKGSTGNYGSVSYTFVALDD